ncbi:MAG TPA: flagellar assembly protein H [Planctomycetaceae bacterium]|nr:flagellar assembly protein H [Planctomycetaceae bacterium]HRF09016.1 FliH/SctL family protein [Xanthobacteraceae bacterium]
MSAAPQKAPAKFLFDVEFGTGGRFGDLSGNAKAAIADAEKIAFREGFEAAKKEAEQKSASQLERIATDMKLLIGRLAALETQLEREAIDVAAAIARQLAPALIARQPLAEIEALVVDVLSHVRSAPHVAIRVAPEMAETAGARLKKLADERGFASRLVILPDPAIKGGNCLIEWADGGVSRDMQAIDARIQQAIQSFLGVSPGTVQATEN